MKLHPEAHEVRTLDYEYTVSSSAGLLRFSRSASWFRGQKQSFQFGQGYAFTETLTPGRVYKYRFNTNEIKKPLQEAVTSCGWTYRGIAFGKL
jgi:hypothetical protein